MPDQPLHFPSERETIVASILKSRLHLWQLQCDLHDTASRSRETISQSLDPQSLQGHRGGLPGQSEFRSRGL